MFTSAKVPVLLAAAVAFSSVAFCEEPASHHCINLCGPNVYLECPACPLCSESRVIVNSALPVRHKPRTFVNTVPDLVHPALRYAASSNLLPATGTIGIWVRHGGGNGGATDTLGFLHDLKPTDRIPFLNAALYQLPVEVIPEAVAVLDQLAAVAVEGTGPIPPLPTIEPADISVRQLGGFLPREKCEESTGNAIEVGRELINSDLLKGLISADAIRIGLVDSGVDILHPYLKDALAARFDCTTQPCGANSGDDDSKAGHGTMSAGILSARSDSDLRFQGVTPFQVVSFKVGKNSHVSNAVERALLSVDPDDVAVVLADVSDLGGPNLMVATAADKAFDAGIAVIAPLGNYATVRQLGSPAVARKALGVGAVSPVSPHGVILQAYGPTQDGRTKPDLLAPTNTMAPTNNSNAEKLCSMHGNTSGAAPYAAGAAALWTGLLKQYLKVQGKPGLVYALMIATGQADMDCKSQQELGGGLFRIPSTARIQVGHVNLVSGQSATVELGSLPRDWNLHAAIWWPESENQRRSDFDLAIRNPRLGQSGPAAQSYGGVFERTRAPLSATGPFGWSLAIDAIFVQKDLSQTVYWAAIAAPPQPES